MKNAKASAAPTVRIIMPNGQTHDLTDKQLGMLVASTHVTVDKHDPTVYQREASVKSLNKIGKTCSWIIGSGYLINHPWFNR